jgi:hypothetical protein
MATLSRSSFRFAIQIRSRSKRSGHHDSSGRRGLARRAISLAIGYWRPDTEGAIRTTAFGFLVVLVECRPFRMVGARRVAEPLIAQEDLQLDVFWAPFCGAFEGRDTLLEVECSRD